jgi:hypothetical protein
MKETRKVQESLPLEMEARKKKKNVREKNKKPQQAATEAVATAGRGSMV